jgi:hypothetical protein
MPRNTVINRRNISNLKRHTLLVSGEAVQSISEVAESLSVSQGSLIDTALSYFSKLPVETILDLLYKHEHLTEAELKYIKERLEKAK